MKQNRQDSDRYKEIRHSKVFHDYFVEDKMVAGIVLKGTEVKSIRLGRAQIRDAFVKLIDGEAFLFNAHIDEYTFGNVSNHLPTRSRKLLLKKANCAECVRLWKSMGVR